MKTVLALLTLVVAHLSASPLYTTQATLTGVNGQSVGGYYTGPYYLTVGGEQFDAFCDDFPDHVDIGDTWDVDVYSGADTTGAYFADAQYGSIFELVDLASRPGADLVSIQQAIWRVTDPAYISGGPVTGNQTSPGDFLIISGHGAPGSRPQEFVVRRKDIGLSTLITPEPVTWPMALFGLVMVGAMAGLRRRK